jgi:PAS domain S-box-containing protein
MPQIVWTSTTGPTDYLNAQWFRYTGIDPTENANRSWTEALHPDDIEATFSHWRRCMVTGAPFETEYRLRRADGTYRWFLGRGTPFRDEDGTVVKWFGTCTDIDDLRRNERAERFVSDAMEELARARDVAESCRLVTARAVRSVATYCVVDLIRENGRIERVAWAHADPAREIEFAEVVNYPPRGDRFESPVARALGRGRATFVPRFDDAWARKTAISDDHYRFLRNMRTSSLIAVPLEAYGRDIGAITFCYADSEERYSTVDLAAFGDVGRKLGAAIENAQSAQHDRSVASRFQRAAMPKSLPDVAGVTFDAVYHAAAGDEKVGGDWYDVVTTKDGHVAISIGDVAGHDLESAVGMIGIRHVIRTAMLLGRAPHDVLETVNAAMAGDVAGRFVTAFVATLDPSTGVVCYAAAGHPQPLVRRASGDVELLICDAPPLGVYDDGERYEERTMRLAAGDLLVLYTDGLIENEHDVVAGESALAVRVAEEAFAVTPNPAIFLRDRLLRGKGRDDVAILVVGFKLPDRWIFEAADAASAQGARIAFSRYIARACSPDSDVVGCEIIFGELIGNVVRHAPGPVEIILQWKADRATLHVYDRGPGFPFCGAHLPDTYSEGGRGIYIVNKLGCDLRIENLTEKGTHVAVELPVRHLSSHEERA